MLVEVYELIEATLFGEKVKTQLDVKLSEYVRSRLNDEASGLVAIDYVVTILSRNISELDAIENIHALDAINMISEDTDGIINFHGYDDNELPQLKICGTKDTIKTLLHDLNIQINDEVYVLCDYEKSDATAVFEFKFASIK